MKKVLFLLASCLSLFSAQAQTSMMSNLWDTDGEIYDSKIIGNNIYLVGKFDMVLPVTGPAAYISTENGDIVPGNRISVNGKINTITPDGNGGFYIGGEFTEVNGSPRRRICQIDAQRNLTAFNLNIDNPVTHLFFDNGKLLIKGSFYRINNQELPYFAVYYTASGVLNQTFANSNDINTALTIGNNFKLHNGYLYFSTSKTHYHSTQNYYDSKLCRYPINAAIPTLETLNLLPGYGGGVSELLFRNDTAFVFGNFTQIGTALRNRTAAINTNTFTVLPWYPNANDAITSAAISGNTLFVSGTFTSIGGRPCRGIAAIDIATSLALDWFPNASGNSSNGSNFTHGVNKLLIDNDKLYLYGSFTNSFNQSRAQFARINIPTLTLDDWFILADGSIGFLEKIAPNVLLTSGAFNKIGGKYRKNFACLSLESGVVQPLKADLNNNGTSLLLDQANNELIITGNFSSVNGLNRNKIAKLNLANNQLTSFNINWNISGPLYKAESGTYLYLFINGGIEVADKISGNKINWSINPIGSYTNYEDRETPISIYSVKEYQGKLIVAGKFNSLNGTPRNHLASFDINTKQLTDWNLNPNKTVFDIEIHNNKLLVAGEFFDIGLRPRNYFAELDLNSNIATNMVANANNPVTDIAMNNNLLYLIGKFNIFADLPFNTNIATFDLTNRQPANWRSETGFSGSFNVSTANNIVAVTKRVAQSWDSRGRFLHVYRNNSDIALSSGKKIETNQVTLYPNPTKDKVALQLPSDKAGSAGTFQVYGVNGAVVQTNTFNVTEAEISLKSLKAGFYLYKVTLDNGTQYSGKVVKE
jgi:hypothetical protein